MTGAHVFDTAHGFAAIAWRDDAVTGFRLPASHFEQAAAAIRSRRPDASPSDPPAAIAATILAVQRYFAGEAVDFTAVALDLGAQGDFAARVYAHVRRIAWGETTTYGAVAHALGAGPEAARAVGRAMANNPAPLIVPCHRVLAAHGGLGGFTAPGGGDAKMRMLALENVMPTAAAQQAFGF